MAGHFTGLLFRHLKVGRFLVQAKKIGPESFIISSLVGFFVGMIMALQMAYLMLQLSAEIYIPNVVCGFFNP